MSYIDATHPASPRIPRNIAGRRPGLAEPLLSDMLRDPILLDLMASDRVRMDSLLDLVASVRHRLGVDLPGSGKPS
jgi:hypothetical protein